jgi:hypothetical protein
LIQSKVRQRRKQEQHSNADLPPEPQKSRKKSISLQADVDLRKREVQKQQPEQIVSDRQVSAAKPWQDTWQRTAVELHDMTGTGQVDVIEQPAMRRRGSCDKKRRPSDEVLRRNKQCFLGSAVDCPSDSMLSYYLIFNYVDHFSAFGNF